MVADFRNTTVLEISHLRSRFGIRTRAETRSRMCLLSSSGYSDEFPITVAKSYGQTLAIASASSPPYPSGDVAAMQDIEREKARV